MIPIGYVPAAYGHYVQNIGNTTLKFLEIFNTDRFEDVSLSQVCVHTRRFCLQSLMNVTSLTVAGFDTSRYRQGTLASLGRDDLPLLQD